MRDQREIPALVHTDQFLDLKLALDHANYVGGKERPVLRDGRGMPRIAPVLREVGVLVVADFDLLSEAACDRRQEENKDGELSHAGFHVLSVLAYISG